MEMEDYINPITKTTDNLQNSENKQVIITIDTEYGNFIDDYFEYLFKVLQASRIRVSLERITETRYLLFFQDYNQVQASFSFLKESMKSCGKSKK